MYYQNAYNGDLHNWTLGEPEVCSLVDGFVHLKPLFLQIC